jgi:hypothetical protein
VQAVPSEKANVTELPSSRLAGKLVPVMVKMLPPCLLRPELGDIELIVTATY